MMLGFAIIVTGCASNSYTIVGQVRPPIDPGHVEVFTSPPRHYEEIALLDASSAGGFGHSSRAGTHEAIYRMKEDAAKLGANGVLLTGMGEHYHGIARDRSWWLRVIPAVTPMFSGGGSRWSGRPDRASRHPRHRHLCARPGLSTALVRHLISGQFGVTSAHCFAGRTAPMPGALQTDRPAKPILACTP